MNVKKWLRWLTKEPYMLLGTEADKVMPAKVGPQVRKVRGQQSSYTFRGAKEVNIDAIVRQIKAARLKLAMALIERHLSHVAVSGCMGPMRLNLPAAVIPKSDKEFAILSTELDKLRRWTTIARALLPTYKEYTVEYKKLENILK